MACLAPMNDGRDCLGLAVVLVVVSERGDRPMAFGKLAQLCGKGLHRPGVTPIAVDFGSSSLKVLQITSDEPPVLVCAGQVMTPENLIGHVSKRLDFQIAALPELVQRLSCKGKRAVCAIPSPLTFCKHMQIPAQEGLSADILADTMLSEQVGRDATTLVRRLIEVGSSGTGNGHKNEYICLASGNEVIDKLIKALRGAKLEVVGMHAEFEALLQAFAYVNKRESDKDISTLYLDIGCCQSRVTIAHGRRLVFARIISFGGMTLDACLAKELACTCEEARAHRLGMDDLVPIQTKTTVPAAQSVSKKEPHNEGAAVLTEDRRAGHQVPGMSSELDSMPAAPIAPRGVSLADPLEILTDEISMCIRYHDAMYKKQPVGSIVFLGGEARHRGMCQHIARALRLPARVSDPLARIVRDGSETIIHVEAGLPQPGWAVAVGLCQSPTDL